MPLDGDRIATYCKNINVRDPGKLKQWQEQVTTKVASASYRAGVPEFKGLEISGSAKEDIQELMTGCYWTKQKNLHADDALPSVYILSDFHTSIEAHSFQIFQNIYDSIVLE